MKKQRKPFVHIDQKMRDRMEALLASGHKQCEVAEILRVSPGSISRERRRKRKNGRYKADTAEHKAQVKRGNSKYQGMKIENDHELRNYIIGELKQWRSPDEIAGRMKREKKSFRVGTNAIYKWLYSSFGQKYCKYLCTKRWKKRKQKEIKGKRHIIPNMVRVHDLPQGAINVTRYGHYEGDTFVSPKKSGVKDSCALVCEKKSKLIIGRRIPNMRPDSMVKAIHEIEQEVYMKTMTMDRGIENIYHEQFMVSAYFCDPSSPHQKPLVEGTIGLLRRWWWPKGTDLSQVSEEELQEKIFIMNNKYRKSLQYRSALEVAREHGILRTLLEKVAIH